MATRDKIFISKDKTVQDIYDKLTTDKGEVPSKPFRFAIDVFLAAAALGYTKGKREALDKVGRQDKFNWSTLTNDDTALPVLRAIALDVTKDPKVLLDDDQVLTIAEEFANGGIHLLGELLLGSELGELHEAAILMAKSYSGTK